MKGTNTGQTQKADKSLGEIQGKQVRMYPNDDVDRLSIRPGTGGLLTITVLWGRY
jgi:hypothetical protein